MKKYSRFIHMNRLLVMLELTTGRDAKQWVGACCPAAKGLRAGQAFVFESDRLKYMFEDNIYCRTCKGFVDIPLDHECCPCDHYGVEKAIQITKRKLREEGYIV